MSKLRIAAIIEARMTSSRLPGKVLLPAGGVPILSVLINRLKRAGGLDTIVLATTTNATDDRLVAFAEECGIQYFRGSEDDVLGRVVGAAESVNADVIVEVTGDCPLVDPEIVERVTNVYLKSSNPKAWASNSALEKTFPIGMDVHVFGYPPLKHASQSSNLPLDREHVTRYFYMRPEEFPVLGVKASVGENAPELSLTLDEPADYELLKRIIEFYGPKSLDYSCRDIVALLKSRFPEWAELNQKVRRRGYSG